MFFDVTIRPKHRMYSITLVDNNNRTPLGTYHGDITHAHSFVWGMVHGLANFTELSHYSIEDMLDAPTKISVEY